MTSNAVLFLLQFFESDHLPPNLRPIVERFAILADEIANGPDNDETIRALEDLVDAKDHAVRALVAEANQVVVDMKPADATQCPVRLGNKQGPRCIRDLGHDGAHRFVGTTT